MGGVKVLLNYLLVFKWNKPFVSAVRCCCCLCFLVVVLPQSACGWKRASKEPQVCVWNLLHRCWTGSLSFSPGPGGLLQLSAGAAVQRSQSGKVCYCLCAHSFYFFFPHAIRACTYLSITFIFAHVKHYRRGCILLGLGLHSLNSSSTPVETATGVEPKTRSRAEVSCGSCVSWVKMSCSTTRRGDGFHPIYSGQPLWVDKTRACVCRRIIFRAFYWSVNRRGMTSCCSVVPQHADDRFSVAAKAFPNRAVKTKLYMPHHREFSSKE